MLTPSFSDYVRVLRKLFVFYQEASDCQAKKGRPSAYSQIDIIIFFVIMTFRRIRKSEAQHRWLGKHPNYLRLFGWKRVPHRITLGRRYKALYPIIRDFVRFLGIWAEDLGEDFDGTELFEDKSLSEACGPVWHSRHRKNDEIPKGLRNLDKDATWSKSEYHGWVYGYGLHLTVSESGFPRDAIVETASVSESEIIGRKADFAEELKPASLTADNSYCNIGRIRSWAEEGIALVTPGKKPEEKTSESAGYKKFVREPENQRLLGTRKTAIGPPSDLISKVLGLENNQKQLPIRGIANVRTFLVLGTLILQFAMIMNNVWGLGIREISHIIAVFT